MNLSRMTNPELQSRYRVVSEAKADSEAEASLLALWLFYGISVISSRASLGGTVQKIWCQTFQTLSLLVISLLVVVVLLAGCASTTSTAVKPPVATPQGLLSFADWRVAYVGQNGHLEVVSLDGKTTLEGVHLPLFGIPDTAIWTAGTSPDGDRLAYSASGGMVYLDVRTERLVSLPHDTVYNQTFFWAPDGHAVVTAGGNLVSTIVPLPAGAVTQPSAHEVDSRGRFITGDTYGWLDNTHLAVSYGEGHFPYTPGTQVGTPQTEADLLSLNISTGALQPIATITSATMAAGTFSLTPDGQEALFSNTDWRDFPFTPDVARVDTATGQITPLPHLTSILPALGGFNQMLWMPNTHLALATTGFPENGDLGFQMLDIDHDTSTPVTLSGYPVAWSPDGRTLILAKSDPTSNANGVGAGDIGEIGSGPYTLTAVAFDANWSISTTVTLTTHASQIPMLGFVHNP